MKSVRALPHVEVHRFRPAGLLLLWSGNETGTTVESEGGVGLLGIDSHEPATNAGLRHGACVPQREQYHLAGEPLAAVRCAHPKHGYEHGGEPVQVLSFFGHLDASEAESLLGGSALDDDLLGPQCHVAG